MQDVRRRWLAKHVALFCCPNCGADLAIESDTLHCAACSARYPIIDEIPNLFYQPESPTPDHDVTSRVQKFYDRTPFPNYDSTDDIASLLRKSREGVYARQLDEQIPFGARVLEFGCGTGQLSNFLGIAYRTVFGADMSIESLRLGQEFKQTHGIENVQFCQMNVLAPGFKPSSMDIVISNGMLPAMHDPFLAFERLTTLVKPGGYIVLGLYHKYARLATDLRRLIFDLTGDRFKFLDQRLRDQNVGQAKKKAWFLDQYKHPQELKHTIGIVLEWFRKKDIEFIKSIPKSVPGKTFSEDESLFAAERPGNFLERCLAEIPLAFSGSRDGGFFIIIGRKPQ